jgi:hypothetical protein
MNKIISSLFFILFSLGLHAQTVPVTFHLDANNTQYQTVKMWSSPNTYSYADEDGDRIFELTLDLQPGKFDYHVLRDNAWGWDPDNSLFNGRYPSDGATMTIADPMISYLLPKDNDMMRENRIQANFAYSASNPPLANSISVTINGNSIINPSQFFNAAKRQLYIDNPPYLANGSNIVTVAYSTNKGSISRSSTFSYQPIKLMIDTMMYRMDHILGWGRVFQKPYPASVFLRCNDKTYTASVNSEGYFGADIDILNGENLVKVAYSEAALINPTDQMTVNAEIRAKWWVELTGSISGSTATIQAVAHDINQSELAFTWDQSEDNPAGLSVSGSSSSLSFTVPTQKENYEIELHVTDANGEESIARKMLTTKGTPHFIGVNERAPWMETMVLYEIEADFFDWGKFSFQNLKKTFQHMKDLGSNAFRITPFVSGGFISWDHFEIYPPYGSIDDLRDMVETAHQFGIKVLFDVPLSHTAPFHPFILPNFLLKEKAEPYYHFSLWKGNPGESDIINSPDNGRQCVYTNLENSYTQEYFTRLMEYWVEVAGADGFRIDCGQESINRSPDFIKYLHNRLRNINPDLFILEEGENRGHPDVSYYDFGDAVYDWKLYGWNNSEGFPGIFSGAYSVDQLHELLTTGTPDSGLVMRYINTGYFDYFSKRFGAEQERSGVAVISTTLGLPNIRGGEEVGLARANGMYDMADSKGVMPFYTRLLKARKGLLGNYPAIERITQNIPEKVYAYTSKSNGKIVLTVVNFSASQTNVTIDLANSVFENKGKTNWYNIVEDITVDNSSKTTLSIALAPWKAEVFAINCTKEDVFPAAKSIVLNTVRGENSIETNGGSLNFMALIFPENSRDSIIWSLEGDILLATLSNGTLTACGCGEGVVTVIARSEKNPSVETRKTIQIKNQFSGQVSNSTFASNVNDWFLWSPGCNSRFEWDNGEGHLIYNNGSTVCNSQLMTTNNMTIVSGKKYRVRFDARATGNFTIKCMVRKNGDGYAALSAEPEFQITSASKSYEFVFVAGTSSAIAQLQFNIGAGNAGFWFDNVSFCEAIEIPVNVTFRVDMKNETISTNGVHLNGSFSNWGEAVTMVANGTIYSTTLKLKKGETIQYKFINGGLSDWAGYEILTGTCAYGNDKNRMILVSENDVTLDMVCFGKCVACGAILPSAAGIITGPTTICKEQNQVTYTVQEILDATSYIWTLPDGAIGTSSTNSITVNYAASAISGNITVKGHNANGDGTASLLAITVNPLPAGAGTITGTTTVCQGQSSVGYSVTAIDNATSYIWTLPAGSSGTSTTKSISVNFSNSAVSGNITVKGQNSCGVGSAFSLANTVNPLPANAGTITGMATVCQEQNSVTYTLPSIANATSYIWTLPAGATGTSNTNSINVNYGASSVSGNISVKGLNACGDGAASSLAITVNAKPSTPVISQNGVLLHSNVTNGNQWYNQTGVITSAKNQDYKPVSSGDYYVIVSANGCSSNTSNSLKFIHTGIDLTEANSSLKVYPNPTSGKVFIQGCSETNEISIILISVTGQVVEKVKSYGESTVKLDLTYLPIGIYTLKITTGEGDHFVKVAKK